MQNAKNILNNQALMCYEIEEDKHTTADIIYAMTEADIMPGIKEKCWAK